MRRLTLVTAVLGLLACQRVPVALDGPPVPDVGPDGPPSLPWVSTYAGTGCGGDGSDGPRLKTGFGYVHDVTSDPATGEIYFVATMVHVIRGDQIVTLAGPVNGSRQKDGPALETSFDTLRAIALGADSAVFVAEDNRVRKIQGGMVSTLAGAHTQPSQHVDGPASAARFVEIRALAIDFDGGLLIADVYGIRKLKDGVVSTIAGSGPFTGYPTAGGDGPATEVQLRGTSGLLVESDGILFGEGHRIRRLRNGQIQTLAGTTQDTRFPQPRDGPLDQALFVAIRTLRRRGGRLYFVDYPNTHIRMIENDQVTTINPLTRDGMHDGPLDHALFDTPSSALALFGSTDLLVADTGNCRLRLIQLAE